MIRVPQVEDYEAFFLGASVYLEGCDRSMGAGYRWCIQTERPLKDRPPQCWYGLFENPTQGLLRGTTSTFELITSGHSVGGRVYLT